MKMITLIAHTDPFLTVWVLRTGSNAQVIRIVAENNQKKIAELIA